MLVQYLTHLCLGGLTLFYSFLFFFIWPGLNIYIHLNLKIPLNSITTTPSLCWVILLVSSESISLVTLSLYLLSLPHFLGPSRSHFIRLTSRSFVFPFIGPGISGILRCKADLVYSADVLASGDIIIQNHNGGLQFSVFVVLSGLYVCYLSMLSTRTCRRLPVPLLLLRG